MATNALDTCGGTVQVEGAPARVSFARESFHQKRQQATPPHRPSSGPPQQYQSHHNQAASRPHQPNPIAAAALEQAQWNAANGYGTNANKQVVFFICFISILLAV